MAVDLPYSVKQINKAGDRLRKCREAGEDSSPSDIELLNAFRGWHQSALERLQDEMVEMFHKQLEFDEQRYTVVGRPLKTPEAITAKLVRLRTRLSTMQDIAGTRITVPNLEIQELTANLVLVMFKERNGELVKDTRQSGDKFGYRAMHVVARLDGRWAEIQIRTKNQDAWANLVETLDRAHGWDLKHGDGPTEWLEWVIAVSDVAHENETTPGVPLALPPGPYDRVESGEDLT